MTQNFTLKYLEKELLAQGTLPKTCYYKVAEMDEKDQTDTTPTLFDKNAYIVEITVANTNSALGASITNLWKIDEKGNRTPITLEGNSLEGKLSFTNTLLGAELPETGGPGTFWYTFSGVAMMAIALMYDTFRRRKRRPVRS